MQPDKLTERSGDTPQSSKRDPSHTPGPWNQIVKMDGFTAVGGRTLIARVFSTAFRDVANEEANARLIAVAPEMHQELEGILTSATDGRECPEWLQERLIAVRATLAALAKPSTEQDREPKI